MLKKWVLLLRIVIGRYGYKSSFGANNTNKYRVNIYLYIMWVNIYTILTQYLPKYIKKSDRFLHILCLTGKSLYNHYTIYILQII